MILLKMPKKTFQTRQQINNNAIKDIKSLFRLKTENEEIKDRIISDIRVVNLGRRNHIQNQRNEDRNKTLFH